MHRNYRILATILVLSCSLATFAFDKASYYNGAKGRKKAELKTALYHIIGSPDVKSYGSLWFYFFDTDRDDYNKVIDRYSNEVRYFPKSASYNAISGMNKEHGIPKSWWGGTENKAYCDLQHLMPSEEKANSAKSNYGMGVVTSVSFNNGSIKVGKGTAGNNGTVNLWEPADEWKGDFARAYFYIVTCYEELSMVQTEGANSMQANTYPKLQPWAYQLYMKWSKEDPVSDLERQRNDVVYGIQGNRNPFIDYEGLEQYIWGDYQYIAFNAENYENPFDGNYPNPGPDPDPDPNPDPTPDRGQYIKVTSSPSTWNGSYLIVYESDSKALNGGKVTNEKGNFIPVTIVDNQIAVSSVTEAAEFAVNDKPGGYSIQAKDGYYIGHTSGNALNFSTSDDFTNTITLSDGEAVIACGNYVLRFNSSADMFRFYKSGQQPIQLYRRTVSDGIIPLRAEEPNIIYDITGRRISVPVRGLYIVNGHKIVIR